MLAITIQDKSNTNSERKEEKTDALPVAAQSDARTRITVAVFST